jgi:hypothetical protein
MVSRWANLSGQERGAYRAISAFLSSRLQERGTIDWALRLKRDDVIERSALHDLIDGSDGRSVSEPWRSAWRLIEEIWDSPPVDDQASVSAFDLQQRIRTGDHSGSLVAAIVRLVLPRLKAMPFSELSKRYKKAPKRPHKIGDLFSIRLTSGEIIDPAVLGIEGVTDCSFLLSLATALDEAVNSGLNVARRMGWDEERSFEGFGGLLRVYYVREAARLGDDDEPDEFHTGIAPSTKLLYSVISRLVEMDVSRAIEFHSRWKVTNSPVYQRLWAALSRDSRVATPNEVGQFLLSLNDRYFWRHYDYPEIAELRARRFGGLNPDQQAQLIARIRKRPPRNHWPRKADAVQVELARSYSAARELQRIEVAGATLSQRDTEWLRSQIVKLPGLNPMDRLDEDFPGTPAAQIVMPNPDSRFDLMTGEERLKGLEAALSSSRGAWNDNPAGGAADWIRKQGNSFKVLADLESTSDGGAIFVGVWERFGWTHSPAQDQGATKSQPELLTEARRVLLLLAKLPTATVRQAIEGISQWLSAWGKWVVVLPEGLPVWSKIWPIAAEATNLAQPTGNSDDLNTVVKSSSDREPMDLDTLNTPAGKLVGVFLAAWQNVASNSHPFGSDGAPRTMRNTLIAATGRSGLIARHRMIEALPFFLNADPAWTREHLIAPLTADSIEARSFWRAIARRTQFRDVLKIIGSWMAERATDMRLGRETRRSLVFSLIVECLHALFEGREPAVPYFRVQQMIRSIDDEVRAWGANAIQRFVRDISTSQARGPEPPPRAEDLFRSAARPFLRDVWPQERSLATPGVSRALADLPATVRAAFVEAVDAIERFLVPFQCWSMAEYGLYGEEVGGRKLSKIITAENAAAFLRLLDRTVGTAEGSVIPLDLADALDHIHKVAPNLAEAPAFRRLATATRRL